MCYILLLATGDNAPLGGALVRGTGTYFSWINVSCFH